MQSTCPEWFSFILASRESCLKSMPACLFKVPLPKRNQDKLANKKTSTLLMCNSAEHYAGGKAGEISNIKLKSRDRIT